MIKNLFKNAGIGLAVLVFVYGVIQVLMWVGPLKVFAGLYLLLGFMIGWETRQGQGHRLWPLVVVGWLPMILWGLSRRGKSLVEEVNEEVAEREINLSKQNPDKS